MKKIGVVGAGIIGLSICYKILKKYPNYKVLLFEKEDEVGTHQSRNNSGVLHSGLYYKPNSLKAKLAVSGIKEMINFCRENEINHEICGKIIIANGKDEIKQLEKLAIQGKKNGLCGLSFINKNELLKREPNVNSDKTLLVPEEGIVSFSQVTKVLKQKILKYGGEIFFKNEIKIINRKNNKIVLHTKTNQFELDLIVNSSGLFSDRTYKNFTGLKSTIKIVPFRGEYFKLKNEYDDIFNHLVYPTPNPNYPFLGVHCTRFINNSKEIGPSAVLAFKREGYKLSNFSLKDIIDSIGYIGLRKFIFSNFKFSLKEFSMSISKDLFIRNAQKMIPDLKPGMFEKGLSGVRAQAMNNQGHLVMDFEIKKIQNQIHILNAPSPGATASLAIASYIVDNYL